MGAWSESFVIVHLKNRWEMNSESGGDGKLEEMWLAPKTLGGGGLTFKTGSSRWEVL